MKLRSEDVVPALALITMIGVILFLPAIFGSIGWLWETQWCWFNASEYECREKPSPESCYVDCMRQNTGNVEITKPFCRQACGLEPVHTVFPSQP